MSVAEHHALSPAHVSCFVLIVSDTRKLESENSGRAIVELLEGAGHTVTGRRLVRDEPQEVLAEVRTEIERGTAQVIITTGGTGIANRDSTYEALTGIFEKTMVGFGELFRMLSFQE